MFKKPNYDHIAVDTEITLEVTAEQAKAVYWAYDRGLQDLDSDALRQLEILLTNIKIELWP